MPDVVLIRPGSTDYDDQHRIQGSLDLPLNQRGVTQVDVLVADLAGTEVSAVYTAPCEPARATAQAIGESLQVPVKEIEGLRNLDQGLWEGLTVEDVQRKYPKVYKQWREDPASICPPEGEMVGDAMDRVRESLQKPLRRKRAFAVVASEPLATLVMCALTGVRPDFARHPLTDGEMPRIERFQVNGKVPSPATSGATPDEEETSENHKGPTA